MSLHCWSPRSWSGVPCSAPAPSSGCSPGGHRFAGQWKCPQAALEKVLGERAVRLGARVLRGRELTDLVDRDDHVVAVAGGDRITAAYLVGCDGEESAVRVLAGFDFPGRDATLEMLRADVEGVDRPADVVHPDGPHVVLGHVQRRRRRRDVALERRPLGLRRPADQPEELLA